MTIKSVSWPALCAGLCCVSPVWAGRYPTSGTQTFPQANGATNLADGTTLASSFLGTFASVQANTLQLAHKTFSGNSSSWKIPNLDSGQAIQAFDVTFSVAMAKSLATSLPGSGWALNFGAIPAGNGSGDVGYTMSGGMVISFDTYANTVNDIPSVQLFCNNTSVGDFPAPGLLPYPPISGGSFNLTNPTTGGTTAAIAYNATPSTVQSAMRAVNGWSTVVVTGAAGAWVVDRGTTGSYASPTGSAASLNGLAVTPGMGSVVITNPQDGTVSQNEIWNVSLEGRGFTYDTTFRPVVIHWDYDGLDLTYNGQTIFTNLPTPGFVPASGNTFGWTAAATNGSQDTYIDDVLIVTSPAAPLETGGPVISEFMAENASILEDEDMDTPDWIEIYNGQNASTNLAGWKLTDGVATWTFPSVTVGAYGHLVVFASGKNRTANTAMLHTNFTLLKTGGTFSLLNPSNVVASTWTYGNQLEDVSYGMKYQGGATGYLSPPSPGSGTLFNYSVASEGPAEDVVWSRDGGLITGSTSISVTPPVAIGAVVRYTTDNSDPHAGSAIFPANLAISATTNLRARVFAPNRLPGDISTRTFLHMDASLSNYNGSGQPFQSNLPLIIMDSFGVNVDAVTDQAQPRPHRYTYAVVVDKNASGWASVTSPTYDHQGRAGTHVRGDSSGGFAQKSYAWETWNSENEDKDVSLLGMPAESDWALHGPYTDKTFIRNFITYSKMRELHGGVDGYGMRVRLVELIFNQDPGQSVSYNDYRGVYVLMERIKRSNNRVDIERLTNLVTDPALITGGYIFRRDRTSSDGNTTLPVGMHSHTPNILNSAQTTWLTNYINAFNTALNGTNFADPVLGYAPYIDKTSFIDNWWFVEAFKQIDGYRLSTYFYKSRTGKIVAAPIWDYNLSLGNANYLAGDQTSGWYWNQTDSYWWARLRQDPNYELSNWDRYWQIRRSIFETTSINSYIDSLAMAATNGSTTPVTNSMSLPAGQPSTLENAAMRHYRKFPVLGTYLWPNAGGDPGGAATLNPRPWQINTTYQSEVTWMKTWLSARMLWLDDQNFNGTTIYRPPNFSNYGGNVPSGTQLTISRYTGTPPSGYTYASGGTLYYTTDGSDPRPSTTLGTESVLLSGSANACKWLVPSTGNDGLTLTAEAGASQWTTYTDPPNIANWTSGVTGVGYERDPASATSYSTLIGANSNTESQMYNINPTCYLRVPFTIADNAALNNIGTLKLSLKYDDGFRAYVNGVLVAGRNDTDPSMTTSPGTAQANQIHDDAAALVFEDIDITSSGLGALRVGTNVLAIHMLNSPNTSSDLLMVPRLTSLPPGSGGSGGIAFTGPITLTQSGTIKARLLANGVWSPITTAQFIVGAVPANATNLVISEIMYNPSGPTPSEQSAGYGDNDFEYIELMNVGAGSIDLTGCKFTTGITFDFTTADPDVRTLPAGAKIVVVANSGGFVTRYGNPPGIRVAGVFSGSLSNSGELIRLVDATAAVIAEFTYGTAEPWPVDADDNGYSLVLNNPAPAPSYNDGFSWRSSATLNGSPGLANSIPFAGVPIADDDKDGFDNFLEYSLGSSPTSGQSLFMPEGGFTDYSDGVNTSSHLRFSYRRNLAADGVTYEVQCSSDLTTWNLPVTYVGTVNNGDGTATVEYRSTDPIDSLHPRMSMRMVVSTP